MAGSPRPFRRPSHSPGRRRLSRLACLVGALAVPLALVAALVLGGGRPAAADFVFGCPYTGGGTGTLTGLDLSTSWSLTDPASGTTYATSAYVGTPIDATGDGIKDYTQFDFDGDGGYDFRIDYSRWGVLYTSSWGSFAIERMMDAALYLDELYQSRFGKAYSSAWGGWTNIFSYLFLDFSVVQETEDTAGIAPKPIPPGWVTVDVNITYSTGTQVMQLYWDTSGSAGTPSVWADGTAYTAYWPALTRLSYFWDNETYHVGVGLNTMDAVGAIPVPEVGTLSSSWGNTPWSDMNVRVTADGLEARVGYTGQSADSDGDGDYDTIGFPGAVGFVTAQDCTTTSPYSDIALGHDPAITDGVAPTALEVDVDVEADTDGDGTADTQTLYADVTAKSPPSALQMNFEGVDEDVDGDGANDGLDTNADGVADEMPHGRIELLREADSTPAISGAVASTPAEETARDVYAAFDVPALPERATIDMRSDLAGSDTDGSGVIDPGEITSTLVDVDVRACEDEWGSATCTSTLGTLGARIRVGNVMAADTDGNGTVDVDLDADGDGNVDRLSSPYDAMSAVPSDIGATQGTHFGPLTGEFVRYWSDESAATASYVVAGNVSGAQRLAYDVSDLAANGDRSVSVTSSGLGKFGVQADLVAADGYRTKVWSVLEDVPDQMDVEVDLQDVDEDGDEIKADWSLRDSTGADASTDAAMVLEMKESATSASKQRIRAAGWIGTASSTTDGIPGDAKLTAELSATERFVYYTSDASMRVELGVTTTSADDRMRGLRLRGRVAATIPGAMKVWWSTDANGTLSRMEATTCKRVLSLVHVGMFWTFVWTDVCSPVTGVAATVVKDMGPPDQQSLTGVAMLPIPDPTPGDLTDDPFRSDAGPDFTPRDEFVHAVLRLDAEPQNEENPHPVEAETWGVEAKLQELNTAALARSDVSSFKITDVCLDAATDPTHPELGLGLYTDNGTDTTASWVDGTIRYLTNDHSVDVQAQVTLPWDSTSEEYVVGNPNGGHESVLAAAAGDYALAELVREPCPNLGTSHTVDPAPGVDSEQEVPDSSPQAELEGRVRIGGRGEVQQTMYLEPDPVEIPTSSGINAAMYMATDAYNGTDVALHIAFPTWLELRQPRLKTCGDGGNQDVTNCRTTGDRIYDQTEWFWGTAQLLSTGGSFGDLDVDLLSDTADGLTDGRVTRTYVHLDQVPEYFTLQGRLDSRMRDGFTAVDLDLTDDSGRALEDITFERWECLAVDDTVDTTCQARRGDESESSHEDNYIPNYRVAVTNLSNQLHVDGEMWSPTYGWTPTAYRAGDCSDFSDPAIDAHVYPGSDPTGWSAQGPRDDDELRQLYVDAGVDLHSSVQDVAIEMDNRVDGHWHNIWYDRLMGGGGFSDDGGEYDWPWWQSTKVRLETDGETDGSVDALMPGMQQHIVTDNDSEACIDVDVPIEARWEDASRLSFAIDSLKATITMDSSELSGGGDASVSFRETYYDNSGTQTTENGLWAHDDVAHINDGLGVDWYSNVQNERKTVGLVDPDDLNNNAGNIPQTTATMSDLTDSGQWSTFEDDGDEIWGIFEFDPLLHKDIEDEMSTNWMVGWEALWDVGGALWWTVYGTNYKSRDLPDAETTWSGLDVNDRWVLPDHTASSSSGSAETLTMTYWCIGESTETSGSFGTLDDGTYLKMSGRSGGGGRIEVYLVGYYANGQVRFVREMIDENYGTVCQNWRITADPTPSATGGFELDVEVERKVLAGRWKTKWTTEYAYDASGNGGKNPGSLTATPSGRGVSVTGGSTSGDQCIWYPGDGDAVESNTTTFSHTYGFPGTYRVMQVCYSDDSGDSSGESDNEQAYTIASVSTDDVTVS